MQFAILTDARSVASILVLFKSGYGNELAQICRGFGEDSDEAAIGALEAKLSRCPISDQRDQARLVVDHAKQIAEQFVKDFGRLEGA